MSVLHERLRPEAIREIEAWYEALPLETHAEFLDLTTTLRHLGLMSKCDPIELQVSAVRREHNRIEMRDPRTFNCKISRRHGEHQPRFTAA